MPSLDASPCYERDPRHSTRVGPFSFERNNAVNLLWIPVAFIIASLVLTVRNFVQVVGRETIVRWIRPNPLRPVLYRSSHSMRGFRRNGDRVRASSLTLQLFHERAWRTDLGKAGAALVSLSRDANTLGVSLP